MGAIFIVGSRRLGYGVTIANDCKEELQGLHYKAGAL